MVPSGECVSEEVNSAVSPTIPPIIHWVRWYGTLPVIFHSNMAVMCILTVCSVCLYFLIAICQVVTFHNATIRCNKKETPYCLFFGQEALWGLSDFSVFGCPSYVLHKRLHDRDNYSKWKTKSWLGAYIGPSMCHATNTPFIYHPQSTHVSPQLHVIHDESFTSAMSLPPNTHEALMNKFTIKVTWCHPAGIPGESKDLSTHHFCTLWSQSDKSDPTMSSKRTYD